ncbi:branched-chain amino acid ABC transporter permease [Microbacterium sp.]|uniref:branched-chain amino acid ABC transporter permease n=1 Tax=Microbacterium sp. TaxID=51671 RepID=UPI003C7626A4
MDFWVQLLKLLTETAISPTTAAFALAAIGLNVHFGFTGLVNMGQAGFMLIGAYGFAITAMNGGGFWVSLLVSLIACTLFALVLGIPTLRLRGDYLAIVTISAAEIVRMVGRSSLLTNFSGGANGIPGGQYRGAFSDLSFLPPGKTTILWFSYENTGVNDWWTRLVAWSLVALGCLFVWLAIRSPWGRVLKGIREDEDAVRSLGKSAFSYKMQALVIGGIFGGLGGIFMTMPASVQPDGLGRPTTFWVWTILLLGGAATVFGPVLGSVIFLVARLFIVQVTGQFVPNWILNTQQTEQFAWVLVGVALMLIVIFRPQGILGNKKELSFNV